MYETPDAGESDEDIRLLLRPLQGTGSPPQNFSRELLQKVRLAEQSVRSFEESPTKTARTSTRSISPSTENATKPRSGKSDRRFSTGAASTRGRLRLIAAYVALCILGLLFFVALPDGQVIGDNPIDTAGRGDFDEQIPTSGAERQTTVSVAPSNQKPRVLATATPDSGVAPLQVMFVGSASDADEDSLRYRWDFGDGSTSTLTNPSHTYTKSGTYRATLTVSDQESTTTRSLTIVVAKESSNGPDPVQFPNPISCSSATSTVFWFLKTDGSPFGDGRNVFNCKTVTLYQPAAPENIGERFHIQFERCWAERILVDYGSDDTIDWTTTGTDGLCSDSISPSFLAAADGSVSVTLTADGLAGEDIAYYLAGYRD